MSISLYEVLGVDRLQFGILAGVSNGSNDGAQGTVAVIMGHKVQRQ